MFSSAAWCLKYWLILMLIGDYGDGDIAQIVLVPYAWNHVAISAAGEALSACE